MSAALKGNGELFCQLSIGGTALEGYVEHSKMEDGVRCWADGRVVAIRGPISQGRHASKLIEQLFERALTEHLENLVDIGDMLGIRLVTTPVASVSYEPVLFDFLAALFTDCKLESIDQQITVESTDDRKLHVQIVGASPSPELARLVNLSALGAETQLEIGDIYRMAKANE